VGDLCLQQGDTKAALAMYDKAGRMYAEHGSGKSVVAVCGKILKALPESTHVHIHYTRLLIEAGHAHEARKVLVNYATSFELPKVQRALKVMEGKSDEEMAPMLEMVLEMAEWGEDEEVAEPVAVSEAPGIAELEEHPEEAEATPLDTLDPIDMQAEVAQPDIAQPTIPGKEEEKETDEFEIAKDTADMLGERPVQRTSLITGDIASEVAEVDAAAAEDSATDSDSLIQKSGEGYDIEQESVPESAPVPDEGSAADRAEVAGPVMPVADAPPPPAAEDLGDVPALDVPTPDKPLDVPERLDLIEMGGIQEELPELEVERFSERTSTGTPAPRPQPPRPSGSVRTPTPQPRPSAGHRRASAPYRAQGRQHGKPRSKKSHLLRNAVLGIVAIAIAVGVVLSRVVPFGGAGQGDVGAPADAPADSVAPAAQGFRPPPAPAQPSDSVALQLALLFDSVLDSMEIDLGALQAEMIADSIPDVAPPARPDVPIVGVDRLPIETVRALFTLGETGSRVIQILESGERLTLTIFPIPRALRSTLPMGQVSVFTAADGMAEGTARVGNYQVRARARINAELLEVLLQQVVEVRRN